MHQSIAHVPHQLLLKRSVEPASLFVLLHVVQVACQMQPDQRPEYTKPVCCQSPIHVWLSHSEGLRLLHSAPHQSQLLIIRCLSLEHVHLGVATTDTFGPLQFCMAKSLA